MCVGGRGGVLHTQAFTQMAHDKSEDRRDVETGHSALAAHLMHVTETWLKAVFTVVHSQQNMPKKAPSSFKHIQNAGMQNASTQKALFTRMSVPDWNCVEL